MLGIILTAALIVSYRYTEINSVYTPPDFDYSSKKNICFFGTVAGGKRFDRHQLYWRATAIVILVAGTSMFL
jgi:hypothetical protein